LDLDDFGSNTDGGIVIARQVHGVGSGSVVCSQSLIHVASFLGGVTEDPKLISRASLGGQKLSCRQGSRIEGYMSIYGNKEEDLVEGDKSSPLADSWSGFGRTPRRREAAASCS